MPGPLPKAAAGWRMPDKPTYVVELSRGGMEHAAQSGNPGLIGFCGQLQLMGLAAEPVDYDLMTFDQKLVQVQTVKKYHGWTADIQTGVDYLVLVWPHDPPKWYRVIGWLDTERARPFPIPHHLFRAFKFGESGTPDDGVGTPRLNVVRP